MATYPCPDCEALHVAAFAKQQAWSAAQCPCGTVHVVTLDPPAPGAMPEACVSTFPPSLDLANVRAESPMLALIVEGARKSDPARTFAVPRDATEAERQALARAVSDFCATGGASPLAPPAPGLCS
jgi:hypothetical protein